MPFEENWAVPPRPTSFQPLGDFSAAWLQQSSHLPSVSGQVPPESRDLPLHVFQPQTNPRYQCSKSFTTP
jgi:hypothetical protein